jgi:hypothetical protein
MANMQKQRYWLYQRSGVFYLHDSETGRRESLNTRSKREAEKQRLARNEAAANPKAGYALARALITAHDPLLPEREWQHLFDEYGSRGKPQTQAHRRQVLARKVFDALRHKKLIETASDDFIRLLAASGAQVHHNLRCLQNLATGLGWLPWAVLPPKLWPPLKVKRKRGITAQEHQNIIDAEKNVERRRYYELLWETGAAQGDAALLRADNFDWEKDILSYARQKTGEWCHLRVGERLKTLVLQLPESGLLFPGIAAANNSARAAEFRRRCRLLKINGVSLHSYRYAWAERARACGYPERWAQNALGHNSRAVHQAYARNAAAICPPLETFEASTQRQPGRLDVATSGQPGLQVAA